MVKITVTNTISTNIEMSVVMAIIMTIKMLTKDSNVFHVPQVNFLSQLEIS